MYVGFNLEIKDLGLESLLSGYYDHGLRILEKDKAIAENEILEQIVQADRLDTARIMEHWFPGIECDVFISHSHNDERLAVGLAGFLHNRLGLRAFVDSAVWGYAPNLLSAIDDKYCYDQVNGAGYYNYIMRNKSTSHVYMMLSASIMTMIDKCECVFFLNTPKSISKDEMIGATATDTTDSPWLFVELSMSKFMRQRPPRRPILKAFQESMATRADSAKIPAIYDADLSHLISVDCDSFCHWAQFCFNNNRKGDAALDEMYRMKVYGA